MATRCGILAWLALSALLTANRAPDWADEGRLWREAHAASPDKPRPLVNLAALAADREGDVALARLYYNQALEGARRRGGREQAETELVVRLNLILLRAKAGEVPGAREDFEALVVEVPRFRSRQYVEEVLWPGGR